MNGSGQTPNAWRIAPDEILRSRTPKGAQVVSTWNRKSPTQYLSAYQPKGCGFITEIFIAGEKNINRANQVERRGRVSSGSNNLQKSGASPIPGKALWKTRVSTPNSKTFSYIPS
jgi:hypothetical protein